MASQKREKHGNGGSFLITSDRARGVSGMNDLPDGIRGRVLAVLLLVVGIAAVWAGIVDPAVSWYGDRAEHLKQQNVLAARMAQVGAQVPELRRRLESPAIATPVILLEGNSDAVAGASLQQHLQQIGTVAGANLASTEMIAGEQVGPYRRIGVRLSFAAPWPVVVQLLDAIASGTPPLLINDLQIQSARFGVTDADPTLTTSMIVFGFRAGSAS